MPIEVSEPYTDGWWLAQLYAKLRDQQKHADEMHKRYIGDPPLPALNPNQRAAVYWFIKKSRTNFERLIVNAVKARLKIRGIRTAVDNDEGGDAEAFTKWKRSRGKLWAKEAHEFALSMGLGFVMVGKNERGKLLVTAEDPRSCAVITDPADPLRVVAGLKLIYDPVEGQDVAYLFRVDGDRSYQRIARRKAYRSGDGMSLKGRVLDREGFDWVNLAPPSENDPQTVVEYFEPKWLQGDEAADRPALCPLVPFFNEDGMAEFEPHLEVLDRITQGILHRMTIVTIQAFKQRAMKGLPKTDPETGEEINYDNVFIAEPGAIWNIPAAVEIWESGEVNLQSVLLGIRDDIKDLAAVSGTPLYTVTPDVANGSAEGASLQREQLTFKVEDRQDRWELSHELVCELIFRTEGDEKRAEPGTIEIMWSPADRPSMSERANAIAQTKGVVPRYIQLTEIWGLDPATADRAMTYLQEDMTQDAAMAAAGKPPQGPQQPQQKPGGQQRTRQVQPREQGASEPPQVA